MAGGRKQMGFAGRKFSGQRLLNGRTPGLPSKHTAWAGVQLSPGTSIKNQSIEPRKVEPRTMVVDLTHLGKVA